MLRINSIEDLGLSRDNRLINDMAITWEDDLSYLNEATAVYLIARIAVLKLLPEAHGLRDYRAEEVIRRLDELSFREALVFAKALLEIFHT